MGDRSPIPDPQSPILNPVPPSPAIEIAAWLACLAFVMWLANQGKTFLSGLREQPPPAQTYQPKGDYAFRSELRDIEVRFETNRKLESEQADRNSAALFEKLESLRLEIKSDNKALHGRINGIESETHGNTVASNQQNQILQRIQDRLDKPAHN